MLIPDCMKFYNSLNSLQNSEDFSGIVAFKIAMNKEKLESVVKNVKKAFEMPKKLKEYENGVKKLLLKVSKKDESGKPITKGNDVEIEDIPTYESEMKILNETYKDEIDKYNEYQLEVEERLNKEDFKVEFEMIEVNDLPQNTPPRIFQALLPMIKKS